MAFPEAVRADSPPTVADTKQAFLAHFPKPLPSLYSTIIHELLVQQHLFRWNTSYCANPITSLGLWTVLEQTLGELADKQIIVQAFFGSLSMDIRTVQTEMRQVLDGVGKFGTIESILGAAADQLGKGERSLGT